MPPLTADLDVRTRRVYSLQTPARVMYLVMAAVLVGCGISFSRLGANAMVLVFALLFAIPGLILALWAWRSRLTLTGDRLELRLAFSTRKVRRDDIDGLQRIRTDYGTSTRIFLKKNRGAFTISGAFTGKDDLEEWLKGLPDVDARNAARIEQMIDGQAGGGIGWQRHEDVLERAGNWAFGLNAAAVIACVAAAVPYRPVSATGTTVLLLFAPLGIFLLHRFPLRFAVFKVKADPRAELGFFILSSGCGVLVSGMFGSDPSHLVDPTASMIWGVPIFLAFCGALAGAAWKSPARWAMLAFVLISGIMYSVGVVDAADTLPDDSAPSFFRTWVVAMHEVHHRRYTEFDLRVASWGPMSYADDIGVSAGTYRRSAVGDPVCLALHRGFLHAPWYEPVPCTGPVLRDAALSIPETAREASALLAEAQRGAALRPRGAHAQFVLGQCFVQLKRYHEALPPLLAAERLDSTDAWTHNSIGWAFIEQGRFAEAVPHLRAAVALDSTYDAAQGNLAWAYLKLHDLPDAERTYRIVVRLDPTSGDAAYLYAWVLEQLHGPAAAESQLARAIQLEPNNGEIQAYAGSLFRREARFADARQHFETATRLLPTSAAVWAELASTDYLMNDRAAAAAAFTHSASLDPTYVRSRPGLLQMWRNVAPIQRVRPPVPR